MLKVSTPIRFTQKKIDRLSPGLYRAIGIKGFGLVVTEDGERKFFYEQFINHKIHTKQLGSMLEEARAHD
jgi:hypothetical protein